MQKRSLFLLALAAALFAASPVKASIVLGPSAPTPLTATFGNLNVPLRPSLFNSGIYGEVDFLLFFPGPFNQQQVEPNIVPFIPAANLPVNVYVQSKNGSPVLIGHFTTLSNGQFNVGLPPGTYFLAPTDPFLEALSSGPIVVTRGQRTLFFLGIFGFID